MSVFRNVREPSTLTRSTVKILRGVYSLSTVQKNVGVAGSLDVLPANSAFDVRGCLIGADVAIDVISAKSLDEVGLGGEIIACRLAGFADVSS